MELTFYFIYNVLLLHIVLISLFGYCLYLGARVMRKLHGGRFTSVLPPLMGAIGLLFAKHVVGLAAGFTPYAGGETLTFSTQILQLIAGVLLIDVLYKLYQISYATSGFWEGK